MSVKVAQKIRKEFSRWLSLPNYDTVDVIAATLLANRLPGKAIWLAIVGAPATGKTEIAQALESCLNVHMIDGITPATFSSGFRTSKNSNQRFGLLEKMQDGKPHMVIVKDFSAVLQKRPEQRGEILATLRNLYDGKYSQTFGNDITVEWKGKMGMIVCSTGQYDKELKSLATFGDRFLVFRPLEGKREEVAERASRNAKDTDVMEQALQKAYCVLDKIKIPEKVTVNLEGRRLIAELANFVTRARSIVPRHPYTREVEDLPELEGTARVAVQLTQLARGFMVYFGRPAVSDQDIDLMESISFSSIPPIRTLVLATMDIKGTTSGASIARHLEIPLPLVRRAIEDLKMLEILSSPGSSKRLPTGGWEIAKKWKPHVFRMKKWYQGRKQQ